MRLSIAAALLLIACDEASPRLYVEITSSLEIPRETNALAVKVSEEGAPVQETSHTLGEPPRDVWPQILPIVAERGARALTVAVELRTSRPGRPSVAVGYGEVQAALPETGEARVALEVARACVDRDGDGYGNGLGCASPDCDDTRADVPVPVFCPNNNPDPVDGGVSDRDAGLSDTGVPASGELCGSTRCTEDTVCFSDQCLPPCSDSRDCPEITQGCLPQIGVCICGLSCENIPCPIGTCVNGCCDL